MGNIAIRVENLSKSYQIAGRREKYKTLRESLTKSMATPFRRARHLIQGQAYGASEANETFWALQDVSFEVKHGEVIGIIGRNGAGKSTLLKILSRITEPTGGYADVYGRVGALLEVGTGFHPELTGRENIYLNGAILGMSREEIARKFDEIVAFAEVERFIDTPVKHYSSGMGLRLGFAVAAHLEPEILLVDEVLAVGDAKFQEKCIGKMENVADEGRTVLFVSHNIPTVRQLCGRGVVLDDGKVFFDGTVDEAIESYLQTISSLQLISLADRKDRRGTGEFRFTHIELCNSDGERVNSLTMGRPARIIIHYTSDSDKPIQNVRISFRFEDMVGFRLFTLGTLFTDEDFQELPPRGALVCHVPNIPLVSGYYKIFLRCAVSGVEADMIRDAGKIEVTEDDLYGTGRIPVARTHGVFTLPYHWEQYSSESISNESVSKQ